MNYITAEFNYKCDTHKAVMIPRKVIRSYDNTKYNNELHNGVYVIFKTRMYSGAFMVIQRCNIRTELCGWSIIVHFVCFPFSAPEARAE